MTEKTQSTTMKALVLEKVGTPVVLKEVNIP